MRLQYKLALITGGSEGIGLAIAEALVREGTDVVFLASQEAAWATGGVFAIDGGFTAG